MQDEPALDRSTNRAELPLKRQAAALLVCLALPFAAAALARIARWPEVAQRHGERARRELVRAAGQPLFRACGASVVQAFSLASR